MKWNKDKLGSTFLDLAIAYDHWLTTLQFDLNNNLIRN